MSWFTNLFKGKEKVVFEEVHQHIPLSVKEEIIQRIEVAVMFDNEKNVMQAIYDALGERDDRILSKLTDEEVLEKLKTNI